MLRFLCRLFVLGSCLSVVAINHLLADDPPQKVGTKVGAAEALPVVPLDRVRPLVDARHFDEAERLARQMLAEAISSHGDNSLECAQSLDALVHVQLAEGDPPLDELRRNAERALTIKEALTKEDNLEVAASLNNIGKVQAKLGNYESARDYLQRNVSIREKLQGPGADGRIRGGAAAV
jgi:tetratricopeptide (TPR) repeat protein